MANTYFQFKQFTIHQELCAMKVTTDACILGAWFAAKVPAYSYILDIGSGTGLLMMMLAQQTQAEIHGIEIDLSAFKQLKENVQQSTWKDRLKVFIGDVRTYTLPHKYNFIISNPPFFENDLVSETDGEQLAKHSKMLKLDELVEVIDNNLESGGNFGILLPWQRWAYFNELATARGFHLVENLAVKQTPQHNYFRAILHYSRHKENFTPQFELVIKEDNQYTADFVELMKGYYLHL
jgi:tRNA1Val (adenine37-N6)-methyltransferase